MFEVFMRKRSIIQTMPSIWYGNYRIPYWGFFFSYLMKEGVSNDPNYQVYQYDVFNSCYGIIYDQYAVISGRLKQLHRMPRNLPCYCDYVATLHTCLRPKGQI